MKKVLCAVLAIMLIFAALPLAASAAPETLYLDPAYAGGDSDGTVEKPFTTIKAALISTAANGDATKDVTLMLLPGTYLAETIIVGKESVPAHINLTIIGTMGATRTAADSSVIAEQIHFRNDSTDVACPTTIKDVCLISNGTSSTGFRTNFPITIDNCYAYGWSSSAFRVFSTVTVTNSTFENVKRGIHMDGTYSDAGHTPGELTFDISNCTFIDAYGLTDAGYASKYGGLALSGDYAGAFEYNYFEDAGINIYSSDVQGHNNALLSGANVSSAAVTPDLSNNYWGATEPVVYIDGVTANTLPTEVVATVAASPLAMSPFPDERTTDVIANSNPSYIITIPESVDFGTINRSMGEQSKAFDVAISDALLDFGAKVTVGVNSDFSMKNAAAPAHVLAYKLFNDPTAGEEAVSGNQYCAFGMAEVDGVELIDADTYSAVFNGRVTTLPAELTRSGSYSDTMVFVCEYVAA